MSDDAPLTDDKRFPLIDAEGRAWLEELRQHEFAPRYNFRCGDRLTAAGLERVRAFERSLDTAEVPPSRAWVEAFTERCLRTVPFYRRHGASQTITRDDLRREPWSFVPDDQPLDDMVNFWTSGTTNGHSMDVLMHPDVFSMRLPMYRKLLARRGRTLEGGPRRTAILFVCSQSATFTYASVSAYLGGAGHVKINLNPADWRDPDDRVRFVDALQPEIVTGDPLAFLHLAALGVSIRPKALISGATALLPHVREQLEQRFGCPVIDLYSTTETGPIAADFELFLPDVHVEILDGEIVVTGGRNPFLPLLRYRTGDFAALEGTRLVGFEGRTPVVFRTIDGRDVPDLDVTIVMRRFPVAQFTVRQNEDLSLEVRVLGESAGVEAALRELFGATPMTIGALPDDGAKRVTYSRVAHASACASCGAGFSPRSGGAGGAR